MFQNLGEDGQSVISDREHIWRLPRVNEAVRSMARHGQNNGNESFANFF